MPLLHVPTLATTAFPPAPSTAGAPLIVSVAATFATGCEAMPESAVPVTAFATTGADW
jgi:hypothetical protein